MVVVFTDVDSTEVDSTEDFMILSGIHFGDLPGTVRDGIPGIMVMDTTIPGDGIWDGDGTPDGATILTGLHTGILITTGILTTVIPEETSRTIIAEEVLIQIMTATELM